jgi:hypothetical protein
MSIEKEFKAQQLHDKARKEELEKQLLKINNAKVFFIKILTFILKTYRQMKV